MDCGGRSQDRTSCSPWENGYCESFNSRLRDELLNGEIFYILEEAKVVIESWRRQYNTARSHSSLSYKPPVPEAVLWPASQSGSASPAAPAVAPDPTLMGNLDMDASWR